VPIDRDQDDERKARVAALLQAHELRARSEQARARARALISQSAELILREEWRKQREMLIARAQQALDVAKPSGPLIVRFPIPKWKRRA